MPWQYSFPSSTALETATNTTFSVKFNRNVRTVDDFEITPVVSSKKKFTDEELRRLKEEFWSAFLQDCMRVEMRGLVESEFGGDRHLVAQTLAEITGKKISNRTVQAWLIEHGKPSSRTCPEWALKAIKDYVSKPENKEYLERHRKYSKLDSSSPREWSAEVDNKHSVIFATNEILADERRLAEWQQANFSTLPSMLHKFERETQDYLSHLQNKLHAIENALNSSSSFEEFKLKASETIRDKGTADWLVREARRAIENKTGEFANDEGLPE